VVLTVAAIDKGQLSGSTLVVVNIVDINDNAPEFLQKQQTVTVSQTLPVNSVVAFVIASDKDSGINGEVTYLIKPSLYSSYFRIDKTLGIVTSAKSMQDLKISSFNISILATDQAKALSLSSEDNITINIDVSDTETITTDRPDDGETTENGQSGVGNVVTTPVPTQTNNNSCAYCENMYDDGTCDRITITQASTSADDIKFLYWLIPLLFTLCTAVVILCMIIVYWYVTSVILFLRCNDRSIISGGIFYNGF